MATRGTVGGLARATADLALLMDAAGRDYVIIETVGVGQDEVEIAGIAQVTVVVLVPGMGDDVQAIKAGIMEIADIFVINKADHPGADRVELELHAEGFTCPIIRTVATEGKGIPELVAAIESIRAATMRAATIRAATVRERAPVSLDHLGIAVRNLADALPFYESLGLAVAHRETVAAGKGGRRHAARGRLAHRTAGTHRPRFAHREIPREARRPGCTTSRCACRTSTPPSPGSKPAARDYSTNRAPAQAATPTSSSIRPRPEACCWN